MAQIETDDYVLTFDDSPEARDDVFARVLDYFSRTELFSGESIYQSDATYELAPQLVAELADVVLGFDVVWKDKTTDA